MALTADGGDRLVELLTGHGERVVQRWTEVVAASLRGRLSLAELRLQVQELHASMINAGGAGLADLQVPAAGELRAVLADLSRSRARQGFTATETAVSIFALKDVAGRAGRDRAAPSCRCGTSSTSPAWSTGWDCSPSRPTCRPARG